MVQKYKKRLKGEKVYLLFLSKKTLLAAKSPTQSQHQIVRSLEIHQSIADVQHGTSAHMNLQGSTSYTPLKSLRLPSR